MQYDMNTEYTGKISSIITVDDAGNPTHQAKLNKEENSFNVNINVQFFNLIPGTPYQYMLEVDRAWDETKIPEAQGLADEKIHDVQLKATSQIIQLDIENINENLRVSENGYVASGNLQIKRVPIYADSSFRTYKVKITFGAVVVSDQEPNKRVDWQVAETFISVPSNAYRPNLPIPSPISDFPN